MYTYWKVLTASNSEIFWALKMLHQKINFITVPGIIHIVLLKWWFLPSISMWMHSNSTDRHFNAFSLRLRILFTYWLISFLLTNFICINSIYVRDVSNLSAYSNLCIIANNHKSEVTPSKLLEFIESRHLLLPLYAKDLILDSGVLQGPPNVLLLLPYLWFKRLSASSEKGALNLLFIRKENLLSNFKEPLLLSKCGSWFSLSLPPERRIDASVIIFMPILIGAIWSSLSFFFWSSVSRSRRVCSLNKHEKSI